MTSSAPAETKSRVPELRDQRERPSSFRNPKAALGVGLRPLYRLYEAWLGRQVLRRECPHHLGIILDGNRRHGHRQGLSSPADIYTLGANRLDEVLGWCGELAVPAVTLWVCSTDNLNRPPDQVSGILAAVEVKLRALALDPVIHRRRVRVQAIGKLHLLPTSLRDAIRAAQTATQAYQGMTLTIAVAYGGREEIADAVHAMLAEQAEQGATLADVLDRITPAAIGRHIYMAGTPDPDLIIRTSGEVRLSGFLLWQSAFSEFYFCDVPWPAFRKIDFLRAVRVYQQRKRRFGR